MNTDLCLAQETYISASKVLRRTATFESRVAALSRGFAASSGFMPASFCAKQSNFRKFLRQ